MLSQGNPVYPLQREGIGGFGKGQGFNVSGLDQVHHSMSFQCRFQGVDHFLPASVQLVVEVGLYEFGCQHVRPVQFLVDQEHVGGRDVNGVGDKVDLQLGQAEQGSQLDPL